MEAARTMDNQATPYALKREVNLSYEDAVGRITDTLKDEGFGILTEIDIKATLKKKLGQDFTKYIILGACNPPLAFKALTEELDIGLLLPCNVTVYVEPESGKTVVSAIDPKVMVDVTGRKDLAGFAEEVRGKLESALAAI